MLRAETARWGWSAVARIRRESEIAILRTAIVVLKLEGVVVRLEGVARRLEVVGGWRNPGRSRRRRPKALALVVPKAEIVALRLEVGRGDGAVVMRSPWRRPTWVWSAEGEIRGENRVGAGELESVARGLGGTVLHSELGRRLEVGFEKVVGGWRMHEAGVVRASCSQVLFARVPARPRNPARATNRQ